MPRCGARDALWAALLCARALGEPIASGQSGYWVMLEGLHTSEGSIDPPFTEDGEEFTLRVANEKAKPLALTFELNIQKYDPLECPKITINDQEFKYSPVDTLKYEIPLDETIGPIDQVYRIKVADPAGPQGWPWSHENAHVYNLRVLRDPIYKKVVEAVGIEVRGVNGSKIKADKDFDPAERKYHYRVSNESSAVEVKVLCTPYATGLIVDTLDVPMNETQTVALKHAVTQVNVQCQYANSKYTSSVQEKTYALTFERSVHLEHFNVALKISAEQGYCAMRAMEQTTGFVCRSAVSEPNFLAIYDNPKVDMILVSSDSGTEHDLPHAMAVPIKISNNGSNYTLKVLGSDRPLEFPVEVIKTASCSTLKCSTGKLHRKGILSVEAAQAYLCLREVCTAEDEERCCEEGPTCDTMEESWCPNGTTPLRDGARCANAPCNDEDKATCCKKPQLNATASDPAMKKIAFYKELGCSPTPSTMCYGERCYYDEGCLSNPPRLGGLGCWAAGINAVCRFCGFGVYEDCPDFYDCSGSCRDWGPDHSTWCNKSYDVQCPKEKDHVHFGQNGSSEGPDESSEGLNESSGGPKESAQGPNESSEGLKESGDGLKESSEALNKSSGGPKESGERLKESSEALNESSGGPKESAEALKESSEGLKESGDGLKESSEALNESSGGPKESSEGQKESSEGLKEPSEALNESSEGLKESSEGLNESSEGLSAVTDQIVDALGGASEQQRRLGTATAFLGLAAFVGASAAAASTWRWPYRRRSSGMEARMLAADEAQRCSTDEEQADFLE